MAEYIACRRCNSPDCKGCNLKRLETMLENGRFDCLMNENRSINTSSDVAPVVHCKDCKHYMPQKKSAHWENSANYCNRIVTIKVRPYDFCSYGERKDGDGNG